MEKSYTTCPYCNHDFGFVENPQFDGSFLLTCPECNRPFGIIDVSTYQSEEATKIESIAQTAPVEDPPIFQKLEN